MSDENKTLTPEPMPNPERLVEQMDALLGLMVELIRTVSLLRVDIQNRPIPYDSSKDRMIYVREETGRQNLVIPKGGH